MSRKSKSLPITPADIQRAADLAALWKPKWRRLANIHNAAVEDVQSLARDLALTVPPGSDFEPRWLKAVSVQATKLRTGAVIGGLVEQTNSGARKKPMKRPDGSQGQGWLAGQDFGHAGWRLEAMEAVAEKLAECGMTIEQALGMPRTAKEIGSALRLSERQGRRIKRKLEAVGGVQFDFWEVTV